jgi:FkbM family methyltransferase
MTDPKLATEADVTYAYRLILRREPDAAGLAHYRQRVADGLPFDELLRAFLGSDEYLARLDEERLADQAPVDLGGYSVIVQKGDPDFGRDLFHWQVYEEPVRAAIRAQLTAGDVCLDVGANVGVMTFLAASIVGAEGRVIAVEPNPDNVQLLYRGLLFNRFTNVEVLPLAASDRRAVFSLSGRSNTNLEDARGPDAAGAFVQSVALDDMLGDLPRLDLVKLDVEGHEPQALRGLDRLVGRHRPTLLTEFNPRCLGQQGQDPDAYLAQIFARYPRLRALSPFGDDAAFDQADDVMAFWRTRDAEVAGEGKLPKGHLHFDLVVPRG